MSAIAVAGQEMDEGLEEMWAQSTQGISSIDPGKFLDSAVSQSKTYACGSDRHQSKS